MSLIINIDTALETAFVSVADEGKIMAVAKSLQQKDHAAWLHTAIEEIMNKTGKKFSDVRAVAVNEGPGSYTGLRVGMAAAKGFCFALNIPMITVSSLKLIALAAQPEATGIICPLIDARRMEVFTAVFTKDLTLLKPAHALVTEAHCFDALLQQNEVLFCGNAVDKVSRVITGSNAFFSHTMPGASDLAALSFESFAKKDFAGLAYAEPVYVKEFYSPAVKK
jgi:tRNA threonylcarbamoyladenosine biosynthesis protein TsaB